MASKKASGKNIAESARNTVAVKLRLPETVASILAEEADAWGMTKSEVVKLAAFRLRMHRDPSFRKAHVEKLYGDVTDPVVRKLLGL